MIEFHCPSCGKLLRVGDALAGKTGKCSGCGKSCKVPNRSEFTPPAPPPIAPPPVPIPAPPVQPIVAVQVNQQSAAAHSLGIASLVLGVLAFLGSCIPLIGLPVALLGMVLGGVGLVIALQRKGSGIGFPIAGLGLCVLSLLPLVIMMIAVGRVASEIAAAVDANSAGANQQGDDQEWADARNAVTQGDVRVQITSVKRGRVQLGGRESEQSHLLIRVHISNTGSSKKIDFTGFSMEFSLFHTGPKLTDNFGNEYKQISTGIGDHAEGQVITESIYPGKGIDDLLVFEVPIEKAEYLRLNLPADKFGGKGRVWFQIPAAMIVR